MEEVFLSSNYTTMLFCMKKFTFFFVLESNRGIKVLYFLIYNNFMDLSQTSENGLFKQT